MALDSENFPIALNKGLDTKDDPKQLTPGSMLVLQNASFKNPGELSKRDGFEPLPQTILGGGSIANGDGIASFQDELITLDGSSLYSYSSDIGEQVNKGILIPTSLSVSTIVRNTNQQTGQDSAYHSGTGLQCFTWIDSNSGSPSLNYAVLDSTTGTRIISDSIVSATGTKGKVLTLGIYFIIIYFDSSDNHLRYKIINTSTPNTIGSAVDIATDISSSFPVFDAAIINGSAYIAYALGTTKIGFYSISNALVLSSQFTVTIGVQVKFALTIKGDASNNAWVCYEAQSSPELYLGAVIVNSALNSQVLAPTTVFGSLDPTGFPTYNLTMVISGTMATILWEQTAQPSGTTEFISKITLTIGGTVGSPTIVMYRMGLASKSFIYNSTIYFIGLYAGDLQETPTYSGLVPTSIEPTYFLINSSAQVIAKIAPSLSGNYYQTGLLPEILQISSTLFSFAYLFQDNLSASGGAIFYNTGVNNAQINFQIQNALPKLVTGQNLHFGGGQLWMYDGANVVEQGFHLYPENLVGAYAGSDGGIGPSINQGNTVNQMQYVALYEWMDAQGQLHRSNPSPAITVPILIPASPTTLFTATTILGSKTLSSVSSFTSVVVGQVISGTGIPSLAYITQIDSAGGFVFISEPATAGGSSISISTIDLASISIRVPYLSATLKQGVSIVLYRTQNNSTIFYRVSSLTQLTYNAFSGAYVSMEDTTPDSQIVGNEQLYTTGGTLGNINAPAISAVANYQQRMVYLSPENPFQLGYSQQIDNGDPVEFNSLEFVQNLDQKIGQATAIGSMDTELILFGPHSKWLMTGEGPAPNGTQNDFVTPTPIAGVSGCTNPQSVLLLPTGLIYQDSELGWYLLDRSLQEHYIGAPVQQYNSQIATSANLVPNANKCMFTLSGGVNLIYDYYVEQWEIDPFTSQIAAIDSTIFENDVVYLQANGLSLQQTPGVFTDNTEAIPLALTTGWMSLAGLAGFQRAWELQILETFKSPHTLTVNIYTDYSATPTTTKVISVPVAPIPPLFRIRLDVQKCTALQIEIVESQTAPYGEGLSLSSLTLKCGVKKGPYKLPAGNSY
jgi:hypothetical protein